MSEEEKVALCLNRLFEENVYSQVSTCTYFANVGSEKCRRILKERYGITMGPSRRIHALTLEEENERKKERAAARQKYYQAHKEKLLAYAKEYRQRHSAKAK